MSVIITGMDMPKKCDNSCPFFLGCDSPDKFPFVECKLIGNLGRWKQYQNRKVVEWFPHGAPHKTATFTVYIE